MPFDFSDVPVIDTHVHGPISGQKRAQLFGLSNEWYEQFARNLTPADSREVDHQLLKDISSQLESRLYSTSLLHYLVQSRNLKQHDRISVERQILNRVKNIGIQNYAKEVYDREKIKWVLVDHSFIWDKPKSKLDDFPLGRTKWTHSISHLIQPSWALRRGLESPHEIVTEIEKDLKVAKQNGCSGLKSMQAYFRDFTLSNASESEAARAYALLSKAKPKTTVTGPTEHAIYGKPEEIRALTTYQDFLLSKIFCRAGKLGFPVLMHVAVSVSPQLKPWLNDPRKLYSIFDNEEIRSAKTKFLLIHTGYPEYHIVSSLISQYPNVYVDLSHYSADLSYLNAKILGEFLSISSPTKILHGSDTSHPEMTAFAARNSRIALVQIAKWLFQVEQWTKSEVLEIAELILFKNAERLFGS